MNQAKIYRYPTKDYDKHRLWVRFKRIDFEFDQSGQGESQGDPFGRMLANSGPNQPAVYLYLPSSINLKDSSNFGAPADLGGVGRMFEQFVNSQGLGVGGVEDTAQRLSGALDVGVRSLMATFDTAGDIFGGGDVSLNQGAIALAMSRIPFANNTPLGSGVRSATRTSANPHRRSMFENVNLRDFSFQFEFMPDNANEAVEVNEIVQFFRELAYPTTVNIVNDKNNTYNIPEDQRETINSLIYNFPSMVHVDMFYKMDESTIDKLNDFAYQNAEVEEVLNNAGQDELLQTGMYRVGPRIMPCYVTGVDQTLDSQNSMMYRGLSYFENDVEKRIAMPTAQTLSVSLSEDRTIDANAVRRGY